MTSMPGKLDRVNILDFMEEKKIIFVHAVIVVVKGEPHAGRKVLHLAIPQAR